MKFLKKTAWKLLFWSIATLLWWWACDATGTFLGLTVMWAFSILGVHEIVEACNP